VDRVGVNQDGCVDEAEWKTAISKNTALVTFLHANNETGVLSDVRALASAAAECGAIVHVDAVQSAGKVAFNVSDWPVQLLSLSGHKFHGPKGAGALYVRRRTRLAPIILGGGQERKLRGGTENTAGIVGLGVAAEIAMRECAGAAERIGKLRDRLEGGILAGVSCARVIGRGAPRIHNTTNIGFEGLAAEAILIMLSENGICTSSGSACSSGSLEPSHVLKAMGIDERVAHGAIRFSLSRFTVSEEIDRVIAILPSLLGRLQAVCAR
jgi:cysteine desulfurase